jgi:predicted nuclease of predicted toxin-antitoxin system
LKFLVDRCAGGRLAAWLRDQGHDVVELRELGKDPGDEEVLSLAASLKRVLVTIDTDFGKLIFAQREPHAGLVRLPDVRAAFRIALMEQVLARHAAELEDGAIVTVRGQRIRVSLPPDADQGSFPARS